VRRFHRVADILAVALTDLAEQLAVVAGDAKRVAGIRARLLAADVELGGAVELRATARIVELRLVLTLVPDTRCARAG
jgi:hypothetical protein